MEQSLTQHEIGNWKTGGDFFLTYERDEEQDEQTYKLKSPPPPTEEPNTLQIERLSRPTH